MQFGEENNFFGKSYLQILIKLSNIYNKKCEKWETINMYDVQ